ncbi:sensor domain-containing protein [Inmirania thermothiophila]|uniref:PAS domain S-box-containing protein/diguanylate cyclase (GGDEF)-like protein n=1 Tax=Inmirania thermothiophila TaxID=1750597 RepID=A0A3N1Y1A6_9GAMM|nr:EAL domain-containing protein [Inmirania thermothiophila]ROR32605.1 PAS domain S-box-containing protein/diguanylate cyclase (GGDEF)-like protein [Inmirania thermothiophila]
MASLPRGVLLTDTRGRILYANPAFERMTGYRTAELLGRTPRILKSDETPPTVHEALWRTIATGGTWEGEFRNRRRDGTLYWQATVITPVRDESGRITHYLALAEDVSERRRRDEALVQAAEGVSAQAGRRFLHTAVWYLADTLELDRVLIAALDNGGAPRLQLLAAASRDGDPEPALPQPPQEGGVLARILACGELALSDGAAEAFPDDPLVGAARAALGQAIEDEHGQVIGLLLALGRRAVADPQRAMALVRLTARRAGTELARMRSEDALKAQVRLLRETLERLPDPVVVLDAARRVEWANRRAHALGLDAMDPQAGTARAPVPVDEVRRSGRPLEVEREHEVPGRGVRRLHVSAAPLWNEDGSFRGIVAVARDVTREAAAEEALRGEWRRLVQVLEALPAYVCLVAPDGTVRYGNRHFRERFGEAAGRRYADLFPWRAAQADGRVPTLAVFETDQPVTWETQDPYGRWFEIHSHPFPDPDGQPLVLEVGIDITARKSVERALLARREDLERVAHRDPLTGLPNRILCRDRLFHALQRARRGGEMVAVLFLDLDQFKEINDTLGHDVGDEVLKLVARRLRGCLREGDTIARIGGDEFVMILERISRLDDVAALAQKIIRTVSRPAHVGEHEIRITPSLGIAVYPADHQDPDTLIKYADLAMYRAKREGPGHYQFYTPDLTAEVADRMRLREELRLGLERQEFVLAYQPQARLRDGRLVAVEALVRWQHPTRGLIPPEVFVPVAEQGHLAGPLDRWVLQRACRQAAEWQRDGLSELRMAVNLSDRQFRDAEFVHWLGKTLQRTGADPARLELELQESALMEDPAFAERRLRELRALGVQAVVDDYGSGSSALEVLARMPVTKLKISERLVARLHDEPTAAAACGAAVALGRHLGLQVAAEGIERPDQLTFFQRYEDLLGQGYLIGRPATAEVVAGVLHRGRVGLDT